MRSQEIAKNHTENKEPLRFMGEKKFQQKKKEWDWKPQK